MTQSQAYASLPKPALLDLEQSLLAQKNHIASLNLKLNMTRGKPSPDQLDLSLPMLDLVTTDSYLAEDGTDCRNYGGLDGLPEAKALFADYMGVNNREIMIAGNSSLQLMHNVISTSMLHGTTQGGAWIKQPTVKFLCPVPGYDRHFAICEHLNIEMIPIAINEHGPDMDAVEALVKDDASIKGMWCIPKYNNPTGTSYNSETVTRLATMKTAAADFRLFWDDAYSVHHLGEGIDEVDNILTACKQAGNVDRAYLFGSTSKITFPGSGIAVLAAGENNLAFLKQQFNKQTIGPDKLNQLRHVRFFKDIAGIKTHMDKHAVLLKARFDAVDSTLTEQLAGTGIAQWIKPKGGYFISLDMMPNCAKQVVALAGELGVELTPAGSPYPHKHDPNDCNIRIAPSFPTIEEVTQASEVLCLCIRLVAVQHLLHK